MSNFDERYNNTSTEISKYSVNTIPQQELATLTDIAKTFVDSGLFQDTKSIAQAKVKILAGRELGIGPFIAMRDLSIIQGKLAMAAAQIAARIQQSGGSWEAIQFDEKAAILRFARNGKILKPDISFSLEDAQLLGLAQRDSYQKQPRTMLFWRAMTMGGRMFFPGVFGGAVYTPDELRDSMPVDASMPPPIPIDPWIQSEQDEAPTKPKPIKPEPIPKFTDGAVHKKQAVKEPIGNPWEYVLVGESDHKGRPIATLTDDLLDILKSPKARDALWKKGKLTVEDVTALHWCFADETKRTEALSKIMSKEMTDGD